MGVLQDILGKLKKAKPTLFNEYSIKELAIFGSVSRGEEKPESDIDIMVEFEKPVGIEFIRLALKLEELLKRKVDLVSKKGIREKYFKYIRQDLVYV